MHSQGCTTSENFRRIEPLTARVGRHLHYTELHKERDTHARAWGDTDMPGHLMSAVHRYT